MAGLQVGASLLFLPPHLPSLSLTLSFFFYFVCLVSNLVYLLKGVGLKITFCWPCTYRVLNCCEDLFLSVCVTAALSLIYYLLGKIITCLRYLVIVSVEGGRLCSAFKLVSYCSGVIRVPCSVPRLVC